METNSAQSQKFWRTIGNHAELVFEEGALQTNLYDEIQGKNFQQPNIKEGHAHEIQDEEAYLISEGPSRQIIEFDENQLQNRSIEAFIREEAFILDETSNVYLTTARSSIPDISVVISEQIIKRSTDQEKQEESSTIIEVMLCEKSSCPQREKFKIIKGAITGCTRKKVSQKNKIEFKDLKFNYNSNPDKNSKLLIALYKINKERIRSYFQILVSRDIFLIEDGKAIIIDNYESLYQYFQNFTVDFMQRPPTMVKINKQDKHAYSEQISTFQKYLIKKNKKVSHIVYLAFKFPHFVELYFRNDQNQQEQKNLNNILTQSLKQILTQINLGKYSDDQKQLVCNHFNPQTKIVLSINANMRRVRFLMRKQFTKLISIIASEDPPTYEGFEKFASNKQLKEFYLEYNAIRAKIPIVEPVPAKHQVLTPSPQSQNNSPILHPHNNGVAHENVTSEKKHPRRNTDEDYQEDEEEDIGQGESDQSQNYSLSEKKGKKNTKKTEIKKMHHPHHYSNANKEEIKYPTRNKTRQLENQDDDDKKAILSRKNKEKELLQQQQQQQMKKPGQPGVPGGMMFAPGAMPNLPFQIVNPQNPSMSSIGMFPMMQGMQVPGMAALQNPQGQNKDSTSAQNKGPNPMVPLNPMQMTPQMMAMLPNMFGMSGGNMPAQLGGLMGQPFGMMNPAALLQQQQKKQNGGKDSKQDQQNPMMKQSQIPAGMIPMGMNPMLGMQGLNPAINPFAQGMMPGMGPIAVQGPNGGMMLMMPNLAAQPQQQGVNPNQPQTGNPQMPGLGVMAPGGFNFPGGFGNPFAIGMNPLGQMPNNQNSQNSNDKNSSSSTNIPQGNPFLMGMMPPGMMNPVMMNQLMQEQNKALMQKKENPQQALMNPNLSQQANLNKNITSQFNPLQKNSNNKQENNKKDQKPEGSFPPNMQNLVGLGGGFGQMPNPQAMMMFPPGLSNPAMMQMMQNGGFPGFGGQKDKNQQSDKPNVAQGMNPQGLGQNPAMAGLMGFGQMLGAGNQGSGLTPEMLQQLAQSSGNPQMLPMGMMPPGFSLPGGQSQNPNTMGSSHSQQGSGAIQGLNAMGLQGAGLGQMGNPNFNAEIMRQQAIQEMMRKNPNGMFMPGMTPGMGGLPGMFMPPKKDDEDKK